MELLSATVLQTGDMQVLEFYAEHSTRIGRIAPLLDTLESAAKRHVAKASGMLLAVGHAARRSGRNELAETIWREAMTRFPRDSRSFLASAELSMEDGDSEKELQTLRMAGELFPNEEPIHIYLARAAEDAGDAVLAERSYRHALALNADSAEALAGLLKLLGAKTEPALIDAAEAMRSRATAADSTRAALAYGLGKVFAERKEQTRAFRLWKEANSARRREAGALDRTELTERVKGLIRIFNDQLHAASLDWGSSDRRPVFIVGVPRSGTTLVEQIIASHPDADGVGELPHIPFIAGEILGKIGLMSAGAAALSQENVGRFASGYLAEITKRAKQSAVRIIDKTPTNFFHVGLISILFPKARIIWCRRNPLDVCLSIFTEDFSISQRHATDLADLGFYYRAHERLMQHWTRVCPLPILRLSYEMLVTDSETEIRRLIDWLGLPWDAACLEHYRGKQRKIMTPSRWQARQPIYRKSIGRWEAFKDELGPLIDSLSDETAFGE